jgi:hypothetical protein
LSPPKLAVNPKGYGAKEKKPIDMDNLSRSDIPAFINGAWYGWHSFRRGLGTPWNDMGSNAVDIQSILRHANIATTLAFYTFRILKTRGQA